MRTWSADASKKTVLVMAVAVLAGLSAAPAAPADTWVEVRTRVFTVASSGSEKEARQMAAQFEQVRARFAEV